MKFVADMSGIIIVIILIIIIIIIIIIKYAPKLEYASTVWNSVKSTDAKKLNCFQRKLVTLCQYRFSTYEHVTYDGFLTFLKLLAPHNRRPFLDALFLFLFVQV